MAYNPSVDTLPLGGDERVPLIGGGRAWATTAQIGALGGGGGSGNVTGPTSATVNNLAAFSATTGKAIGDSGVALTSLVSTGIANTFTQPQTFSSGIAGTTGAFSGPINTTSTSGFQIGGQTVLNVMASGGNGSTLVGVGAGANLAAGTQGITAIGWNAMNANTYSGTNICENTAVGYLALASLITNTGNTVGNFNTAVGAGSQWNNVSDIGNTSVGGDSMRDNVGTTYTTGIGLRAAQNGAALGNIAVGAFALMGNSSFIQLTGTPTTGDTISLLFAGAFTGSPVTVNYTVLSTDTTLAILTTSLVAAIQAANFLQQGSAQVAYLNTTGIVFNWPGTGTTGWAITITPTVGGAATETLTVSTGSVGQFNIGIGYRALSGNALSSGMQNTVVGGSTASQISSGSNNSIFGYGNGPVLNTGSGNALLGGNGVGLLLTSGQNNTAVGVSTLQGIVAVTGATAVGGFSAQNATVAITALGYQAGRNLVSGTHNVLIGSSAGVGASTSTASFQIAIGDSALNAVATGAQSNIGIGFQAGEAVSSGSGNILIGHNVWNSGLTTGSSNLILAAGTTAYNPANASNTVWMGNNNGTAVLSATGTNGTPAVSIPGVLTVGSFGAAHFTANGTTSVSLTALAPAGASATVKKWLTIVDNTGATDYIACF